MSPAKNIQYDKVDLFVIKLKLSGNYTLFHVLLFNLF